jgi:hypothetical protein
MREDIAYPLQAGFYTSLKGAATRPGMVVV